LHLDSLGGGEGLTALTQLTCLSLAPQCAARICVRGLPRLRRLCVDLSSASCGRDLLSAARSTVHVPAKAHGLAALAELELRCLVWRHWQAGASEADGQDGAEATSSTDCSEASSDASSSGEGSEEEEEDASSSAASSDGAEEQDEDEEGQAPDWASDADGKPPAAAAAPAGVADGVADAQQGSAAGLLDASWGFLQQQAVAGLQARPLACLEQR
jgi:hypothetical protein